MVIDGPGKGNDGSKAGERDRKLALFGALDGPKLIGRVTLR